MDGLKTGFTLCHGGMFTGALSVNKELKQVLQVVFKLNIFMFFVFFNVFWCFYVFAFLLFFGVFTRLKKSRFFLDILVKI